MLAEYRQAYIDVYGHTNAVGTDTSNRSLSGRRARSMADYLAIRGVQSARLGTLGYGETQPIASNDTDRGRSQNRRAEIKIVPVSGGA